MSHLLPVITATYAQTTAYLLGVCLFSISYLVFLNASTSFVVTDIIGKRDGVGDVVGSLSFADELLGLVACPVWGILSDRLGARTVACLGFLLLALGLLSTPHARTTYPDLLLCRLLFGLGAAACTTMISAILPAMQRTDNALTTSNPYHDDDPPRSSVLDQQGNRNSLPLSVSSELTITPARYGSITDAQAHLPPLSRPTERTRVQAESSKLAGFVGMSSGLGALLAVAILLPLPTFFDAATTKAAALTSSFYLVATLALVTAIGVYFGLGGLDTSNQHAHRERCTNRVHDLAMSIYSNAVQATKAVLSDPDLILACAGGFVARSAAICIAAFIPLSVNAFFIRKGLCDPDPGGLLKDTCRRAYTVASILTGSAQLFALLCAPVFGYLGAYIGRYGQRTAGLPLAISAVAGLLGCLGFAGLDDLNLQSGENGIQSALALLTVALLGINQIGTVVSSLGLLARGVKVQTPVHVRDVDCEDDEDGNGDSDTSDEGSESDTASSLASGLPLADDRTHLKGSIAGIYSFCGGAGILILSKLGGFLFDKSSPASPYLLLAGFNVLLLLIVGATVMRSGAT